MTSPRPSFVIIGERKCGTTSLHRWMTAHPGTFLHPETDLNYFVDDATGGRVWRDGEVDASAWDRRHSHEEYLALFSGACADQVVGHKGPDLLYWQPAHSRMSRYLPDGRFVAIIRDPVARAWSHYWNEVGKGRETLSFAEAIELEDDRCRTSAYARNNLSYVHRGFYDESLGRLYQTFDSSRVLVLVLEEITADPVDALRQVYGFIGVDPAMGLELAGTRHNDNWTRVARSWASSPSMQAVQRVYVRTTEAVLTRATRDRDTRRRARQVIRAPFTRPARDMIMPEATRAHLHDVFRPHLAETARMLGRNQLPWVLS